MSNTFGNVLREYRRAAGISQRELAQKADLDFSYISKIENGKVDPPSEEKIKIMASQLGVEAEVLLGLAGKISSEQIRKAVESNPDVGVLLRKLQSRKLTSDQVKEMLNIASNKDKSRDD